MYFHERTLIDCYCEEHLQQIVGWIRLTSLDLFQLSCQHEKHP